MIDAVAGLKKLKRGPYMIEAVTEDARRYLAEHAPELLKRFPEPAAQASTP